MIAGTGEAPSGVVAYEANNLPADYRGTLLVTSWGDHRIERYDLQPHGASFRSSMKPVVVGGDDFRPVGIAVAADGSLYVSDWVDKSYTLHGKGRIWRLRANPDSGASPTAQPIPSDHGPAMPGPTRPWPAAEHCDTRPTRRPGTFWSRGCDSGRSVPATGRPVRVETLAQTRGTRRMAGSADLPPAGPARPAPDPPRPGRTRGPGAAAPVPGRCRPPIRFAAIQWVGEHRLEAYRPTLLEGLTRRRPPARSSRPHSRRSRCSTAAVATRGRAGGGGLHRGASQGLRAPRRRSCDAACGCSVPTTPR